MTKKQRIIVGISGASGAIYGIKMLEALQSVCIETHLVISNAAKITLMSELNMKISDVQQLADVYYTYTDIGAAIASGSFKTLGMVIAPCSVNSMSEIAVGTTSNLLSRAADVTLKERRRLVLMVRETPLHTGHLRTMTHLSEMGAIITPPVPAFYAKPENIDQLVEHSVGRVLDLFDIESDLVTRWSGLSGINSK